MSTRIDFTSITKHGGTVSGSPTGLTIVGGDTAVLTDDVNTYVNWNYGGQGADNTGKTFRLHLDPIDWPATGLVTMHWKVQTVLSDGSVLNSSAVNPFPPNHGNAIGARNWTAAFRDASNHSSNMRATDVHTNAGVNDGVGHQASFLRDLSRGLPWGSFGGPFDENDPLSVEVTVWFGFGNGYFGFRLIEAWLEISAQGEDDTSALTVPMSTVGFLGESIWPTTTDLVADYGVEGDISTSLDPGVFEGRASGIWVDGTMVQLVNFDSIGVGRKDRTGIKYVHAREALETYNNGISIIPDRVAGTALVIFDNYLDDDPDVGNIYLMEIAQNGTVVRDVTAVSTYYWDERDGPPDFDYLPGTGGVWGRVMTYQSNDGSGNTTDDVGWFGENIFSLDLDTGERVWLGGVESDGSRPLDKLFGGNPDVLPPKPGGGNWFAFPSVMGVDPRDGTYWFLLRVSNGHLEPSLPDYYDEGGGYASGSFLVHTDRDGNVLGDVMTLWGKGDAYTPAFHGFFFDIDVDGIMYMGGTPFGCLRDEFGTLSPPTDEFDGVWRIDLNATYPAGVVGVLVPAFNPWDSLVFSTGIYATEMQIYIAMEAPVSPNLAGFLRAGSRSFDP